MASRWRRAIAGRRPTVVRGLVVALALLVAAGGAGAQQIPDSAQAVDTTETGAAAQAAAGPLGEGAGGIAPSGAFLRGAIFPGWGHATTGSITRGAFFFSVEALSGWMVYKSHQKLGTARDQLAVWEELVGAELAAQGIEDPEALDAALADDERVARFRGLVDARGDQREDWLAISIFTLLLSGVDAYVSAHLRDFPAPLTIEGDPTTGAVEVSVRVPVGP